MESHSKIAMNKRNFAQQPFNSEKYFMRKIIFTIPFLIYGASFIWLVTGTESQSWLAIVLLTSGLVSLLTIPLVFKKNVVRGSIALVVLVILSGSLTGLKDPEASPAEIADIYTKIVMKTSLLRYRIDVGRFPTSAEGTNALLQCPVGCETKWQGPYLDSENGQFPLDPWGRPYQYACPGVHNPNSYDFWSLGEDGKPSADDIGNWH